jgi:hypothetical protein
MSKRNCSAQWCLGSVRSGGERAERR